MSSDVGANIDVMSPSPPPLESSSSVAPSTSLPSWPALMSDEQLAAIWREAGYEQVPGSNASIRPGVNQERSDTRYSQQRSRYTQPIMAAQTGWNSHFPGAVANSPYDSTAANAAAAASSSTAVTHAPPLPLIPASNALNYDLMLGHVTHLFRSTLQIERRLQAESSTPIGNPFTFIDTFGTPIQITAPPWQLISGALLRLQAYIPQHVSRRN